MTDAVQTNHLNGFESHYDKGFYDSLIALPEKPPRAKQSDIVLSHLLSHGSITPDEAKKLYKCASLTPAISTLRDDYWHIKTERRVDENGRKYSSYHLLDKVRRPDKVPRQRKNEPAPSLFQQPNGGSDLIDAQSEARSVLPTAAVTVSAPSPTSPAEISVLHLRLGPQGPEIQIVPANESETNRFYRLSPSQIRYLSVNLKLFADLDEEKRR